MIKGILYATAIAAFIYAWAAVWFSLTAFAVLIIASMLCLIGAERIRRVRIRRGREAVWRRRADDPDWVFTAPYWQLPSDPFNEGRR